MQDIRRADLPARDRAICANALDRILERKRILRMKPAPKAVDAEKYQEQKRRHRYDHEPEAVEVEEIPVEPTPLASISGTGQTASRIKTLKERMTEASAAGEID